MQAPDVDRNGQLVSPPLREFNRYIQEGICCIVKLVIDSPESGGQTVQFSMTPDQCRQIARNLMICAQVIELERPTEPQ